MPINLTDLLVFLTAALTLNLTPGNDMMYVLGQSIKGGAKPCLLYTSPSPRDS